MHAKERRAEDGKSRKRQIEDIEGEDNSGSEESVRAEAEPLALSQEKERKVRKFKETRPERKEAVLEMEQKRMGGMPLQRSRSKRVRKRLSQKGMRRRASKVTQKAGRPGKRKRWARYCPEPYARTHADALVFLIESTVVGIMRFPVWGIFLTWPFEIHGLIHFDPTPKAFYRETF